MSSDGWWESREGGEQLAQIPQARWLRPLHTTFYIHLRGITSPFAPKEWEGEKHLIFEQLPCCPAVSTQYTELQKTKEKTTAATKTHTNTKASGDRISPLRCPLWNLQPMLQSAASHVVWPVLPCHSHSAGKSLQAPSLGKQAGEKTEQLHDATESLKRNCCCMKASKAPCYLTIQLVPKEPSFMGYLLNFSLSEASRRVWSSMNGLVVWAFGGL